VDIRHLAARKNGPLLLTEAVDCVADYVISLVRGNGGHAKLGAESHPNATPPPANGATMAQKATLRIKGRHSPMAWLLYATKLTIEVDGTPEKGSWGDRTISVAPGRHEVKIYFKYITKSRCCEASVTVNATDGQTIAMEYRTPMMMTAPGRLTVLG